MLVQHNRHALVLFIALDLRNDSAPTFPVVLGYKLRTAIAHVVYYSAEATEPDLNARAF